MNNDQIDDGILQYHPRDKATYDNALAPISQNGYSNEQEDDYGNLQNSQENNGQDYDELEQELQYQQDFTTNIYHNNTQHQEYADMDSLEDYDHDKDNLAFDQREDEEIEEE